MAWRLLKIARAHFPPMPSGRCGAPVAGVSRATIAPISASCWLAATVLVAGGAAPASAQTGAASGAKPEVAETLRAASRSQPEMSFAIDARTGLPTRLNNINVRTNFTRSLTSSQTDPSPEAVRRAVDAFFSRSRLRSAFPQGNSAARRVVKTVKPDPNIPGLFIATVKQEVAGIPVFGAAGKVTVNRNLAVRSLSASFSPLERVDISERLTQSQAISLARAELRRQFATPKRSLGLGRRINPAIADSAAATAVKTIFDPKLQKLGPQTSGGRERLTWLVSIDAYRIFIDAQTGDVAFSYRDHRSFTVRRIIDIGGKSEMPQGLVDVINEETSHRAKSVSEDAITAYQNSGAVRDYFFAMFGRRSFDNGKMDPNSIGSAIISFVRFGGSAAHWCPSGGSWDCPQANVSVYGTGYARALDVMAHEFMHGLIAFEADLNYLNEAGAVNESLADIFGSLVEFHTRGPIGGNWLIGESAPGLSVDEPLRDLANPEMTGSEGQPLFSASAGFHEKKNRGQPSHYQDLVHPEDPICATTYDRDNGCVHFNSGILNKFAHLIAAGGTHHSVTVQAIGRRKLGRVSYRALQTKLNQSSGLHDAADGFVDSCRELARAKVADFKESDCREIEKAQEAVGLDRLSG